MMELTVDSKAASSSFVGGWRLERSSSMWHLSLPKMVHILAVSSFDFQISCDYHTKTPSDCLKVEITLSYS
jgi:hypothetical protein